MFYNLHGNPVSARQARQFVLSLAAQIQCEDEARDAWDRHDEDEDARYEIDEITGGALEIVD